MKNLRDLSAEDVRKVLRYSSETGEFTWLIRPTYSMRSGDHAGAVDSRNGYSRIRINGKLYLAHRLAWLYVNGEWPTDEIDHIDLNRGNNRISNLREATKSENMRNKRAHRNSKSGVKGVHWHKQHRKYAATIHRDGKSKHIGLFASLKDAAAAYETAAIKEHGEFRRVA